jgi:hypothetical protein
MAITSAAAIAFERYPARRGAHWLRRAYAMLCAHRMPWLFLVLLYYLIVLVIARVPIVGPLALPLLKPVFAVGFLAAAWAQERGERPRPFHLFQGFRANVWALLPLGAVFLIGISLAVLATALVDGGALLDILSGKVALEDPAVITGRMQVAMLFGAACAVPVVFALWFAPALIVFQDCRTLQALSVSLRAALANWRPIGVYALLVFLYGAVLPRFAVAVIGEVAPDWVGVIIVLPYMFLFLATLHISDYVCYRDIFHANESHSNATATE